MRRNDRNYLENIFKESEEKQGLEQTNKTHGSNCVHQHVAVSVGGKAWESTSSHTRYGNKVEQWQAK